MRRRMVRGGGRGRLRGWFGAGMALWLAVQAGTASGQGAAYVGTYNALVSNLNYRLAANGNPLVGYKNGAAGDTVSVLDLDAVRKKVRDLMTTAFVVEPDQWQLSCTNAGQAFPMGLRYSGGTLVKPSLMEGIGDGEGRFTKVPACYVAGGSSVYAATFTDAPLLWEHFQELDKVIRKMRYMLAYKSAVSGWDSGGTMNMRQGWASHTNWDTMMTKCDASYDSGAPYAYTECPVGFSSMMYRDAVLERRKAAFRVGGLCTNVPHRVRYFIIGSKPALAGNSISVFASNGDPISEGVWREWCAVGPTCQSTVTSLLFGSFQRPPWGAIPAVGYQSWRGYSGDARALIEWVCPDQPLPPPVFEDDEDDGLLDRGCACKTCTIETDPVWAGAKAGAKVVIPLGLSDGALACGLRVKAYLTEYEVNSCTRQMYSLDSQMIWRMNNADEGWDFACIKRPSGAEMVFPLKGGKRGVPIEASYNYRLEDKDGGARLTFNGKGRSIFHDFLKYPDKNGRIARVGMKTGANEVYTESLYNRGQWPGLSTGYAGLFYGDAVTLFADRRVDAVCSVDSNKLVRAVEYRYKPTGPTNGVVYYVGSKGFRTLDPSGAVLRDVRVVSDPATGGQEIWLGISTNSGFKVARKEKRRQWVDADSGLLIVEQTDVINEGFPDAASNTTRRAIRVFAWGEETVEATAGAGTPEARTTRYLFHEDAGDTNNYGRLKAVVGPDGEWTSYRYDALGREQSIRRGLKNAPLDDGQNGHTVENVYAGDERLAGLHMPADGAPDGGDWRPRLVMEREGDQEVARTYRRYADGLEVVVRCVTPGASYDDSSNLATTNQFVREGLFKGRPVRTDEPDGTCRTYAYAYNTTTLELTTTEDSGTGAGGVVTNGTRRVTVEDGVGRAVSETVTDIASGIQIDGRRYVRDGLGRELSVSNTVTGGAVLAEYGCCGPVKRRDEDGVETTYVHDEMKRVYAQERLGVTTFSTYDVFGNVAATRRQTAAGDDVETVVHDAAGRLASRTRAGRETEYAYSTNADGEPVTTIRQPDGAVAVETRYRDGRMKCVTGTAVRAVCYDYGVDAGGRYTIEYQGADTGAVAWVKTWQDRLGRAWREEHADGYARETLFDGAGRVTAVRDGCTTRLTEYNGKGEAFRAGLDMDGDGVLGIAGPDRVSETDTGFGVIEGRNARWTRRYVYAGEGSGERTLAGETWQSVDGKTTWSMAAGRTNRTEVVRNAADATRQETVTYPDGTRVVSLYTNGLLKLEQRLSAAGAVMGSVAYAHDAFGRMSASESCGPNGKAIRAELTFDEAGDVVAATTRAGGAARVVRHAYDAMGRRTNTVLASGAEVRYAYRPGGELESQAGARTVPVKYGYDAAGRMTALSTFRQGMEGEPDVTRWLYDERRGWVAGKVYADGTTNRYEYRADGRMTRRTSARGIETRYAYDRGGALTNTAYSDGTAGVGVRLDRLGRVVGVEDAAGGRTFRYADAGATVAGETVAGGWELEYGVDAAGRRTNLVMRTAAGEVYGAGYGYDEGGRLARVTARNGMRADYAYAADGRSVAGVALLDGGREVLRGAREYDDFGYLRRIAWTAGAAEVGVREYEVDAVGQRVRCGAGDGTYWVYGYDELGQLTSAVQYGADGRPLAGRQYAYAYDTSGNRKTATSNGVALAYAANGLNQYERYETSGAAAAKRSGTVLWIGAGGGGSGAGDGSAVMKQQRKCVYDADGNLVDDGAWKYAWDAENRLMMASNATTVVRHVYDYMGRRIVKRVYRRAADAWVPASDSTFAYDGWNLVQEVRSQDSESRTNQYVWGLDLSGTVAGAGGVGGLLAIQQFPRPAGGEGQGEGIFFPCHDGNGNVTALVDTNGVVAAGYEYDPFGGVLSSINHEPSTISHNPFTFSTKYRDEETGLSYYGYRYYSPGLGRWLSRDPLEEQGGVNLYAFVQNAPVNSIDPLGLALYAIDGTWADAEARNPRRREETNVHRFYLRSDEKPSIYRRGPGAGQWFGGRMWHGATGTDSDNIRDDVYNQVCEDFCAAKAKGKDLSINLVGWSRGATICLGLAQKLNDRGCKCPCGEEKTFLGIFDRTQYETHKPVQVNWIGLFDAVEMIPNPTEVLPGDQGWPNAVPSNVRHLDHARKTARQLFFPTTSITGENAQDFLHDDGTRANHNDIGAQLNNHALEWMIERAKIAGVNVQ